MSAFLPCSSCFLCYWKTENLDKTKPECNLAVAHEVSEAFWSTSVWDNDPPGSPEGFYQTFCWKQVSFAKVCISSIGQTSKFMEAALAVPSLPSIPPSLCWDGLRLHRCLVTSPGGETNPMHSWGVWLRLKASQKCALIWRMRGEPGWTWTCLRPFKF